MMLRAIIPNSSPEGEGRPISLRCFNVPLVKRAIGNLLYNPSMQKKIKVIWFGPILLLLVIGLYYIPPIHSRLAWRLDDLRAQIKFFFNPPNQVVFQPTQQVDFESILATTRAEYSLTLTPQATGTPVPTQTGATLTPTITPTPLPVSVVLKGVKYEDQFNRLNYCGPANFSMALTFWDWKGNRDVIGKAVKPSDKDRNVMPYEFQDFISENVTGMSSILRYGGDLEALKRLIAGGFPVIVEKGVYEQDTTGKISWMGHYLFVTGYNNNDGTFLTQDSYNAGPNHKVPFTDFMDGWRSFDYVFVVIFPTARQNEVSTFLGPYSDETWSLNHALEIANVDIQSLTGIPLFFAWFNIGTTHVELKEYIDAAVAYDKAYQVYATLEHDYSTIPFRMMWYQTGPYKAYYYSMRYTDVIELANVTLNARVEPDLEESLLWRGRAYHMAGDTPNAIKDFRAALYVHPQWPPALQALQDLGVQGLVSHAMRV